MLLITAIVLVILVLRQGHTEEVQESPPVIPVMTEAVETEPETFPEPTEEVETAPSFSPHSTAMSASMIWIWIHPLPISRTD